MPNTTNDPAAPQRSARLLASLEAHRAGRLDEAERGYRDCLRDAEAQATLPLAALLLQRARHAEAVALLEPWVAAAPEQADAAVNLSVALRHLGRLEEALGHAQRATRLAPRQLAAWNALGLAALDLGRLDEARAAFEAALRLAPGHAALELHRAHALRRLGRPTEALAAYEAAVAADPRLLEGWRGIGQVQATLGRTGAALAARTRALQLAPGDRDVALEHAVALLQAGRPSDAVTRLEAATRADAHDAQAWAWLGRAHLKQGALAPARAAFERARALDPGDATVAHLLAAVTGTLPRDVESDYIRGLFDDFADRFEQTLVGHLGYATPGALAAFVRREGAGTGASVLDLGCGTGLMAAELARPGRVVDGVDLSARMLEHARAKGLYRELHEAEAGAFLRATTARWDLVVAADVLVYIADPRPLFQAVLPRVAAGGAFVFTIERSEGDGTELHAQSARYRHAPARIDAELREAGFADVAAADVVLRMEAGQPVAGVMLLARVR